MLTSRQLTGIPLAILCYLMVGFPLFTLLQNIHGIFFYFFAIPSLLAPVVALYLIIEIQNEHKDDPAYKNARITNGLLLILSLAALSIWFL